MQCCWEESYGYSLELIHKLDCLLVPQRILQLRSESWEHVLIRLGLKFEWK